MSEYNVSSFGIYPKIRCEPKMTDRALRFSLGQTFAALKYPNYRLWFIGQLVSLVGTWMQMTAQGYLVFQLTQSPAYLGYVSFAAGLPVWLFTLYSGVISDRVARRTVLVITQTSMMILAFILAALTFWNAVQPWHIVLLAFLLGIANAFDAPARQAFVLEMVEREDLTNAIALNSTMFNAATASGPAVAGLTYALVGPAWCFTINGVTFIAVIVALLLMNLKTVPVPQRKTSALSDLKEGLRYVASEGTIQMLMTHLGIVSLFGFGVVTLIPAWTVEVLGGDATVNGLLLSARGVGALIAALTIASLGRIRYKGKVLTLGSFVLPIVLLIFAAARWLPLSLLAFVGVGWGFMMNVNIINALVQTNIPDVLRGRVMGIYVLIFLGFLPIGSLLVGLLADQIGEPAVVAMNGAVLLAVAALTWLRAPALRALE
jgi:MFS family permease